MPVHAGSALSMGSVACEPGPSVPEAPVEVPPGNPGPPVWDPSWGSEVPATVQCSWLFFKRFDSGKGCHAAP